MIYLQNNYLYKDDPQAGILSDTAFVLQIMYHTNLQSTPGQLVFVHDMIVNVSFISD